MVHSPEKVLQVSVHDPLPSAVDLLPHFAQSILRRSPSPISEAGIIEYRFKDRLQPVEQRLLTYAVVNRRYAQHATLARFVPLRDGVLAHWQRLIGVLF